MTQNAQDISIIVPVYNEVRDISDCISSLSKQSLKYFELILVDDGSTDDTIEVAKSLARKLKLNLKILHQNHGGPGLARNLGAKNAKGDILIFIDADMTFEKDYLKNLIAPILADKSLVGTAHDYETAENTSVWSRCWGRIRVDARKDDLKTAKNNGTPFRAMRKSEFLRLGGFDPKYGYADDQTFGLKYGINPIYAPKTICYHKNPETLKQVYKQSRWIGASIQNPLMDVPFLAHLMPLILLVFSPLMIPILSLKKSLANKELELFFPWMVLFITARYFGTISGLFRRIYLNKNIK